MQASQLGPEPGWPTGVRLVPLRGRDVVTALDVLALFIAAQFLEALTAAVLRFRASQKAAERKAAGGAK